MKKYILFSVTLAAVFALARFTYAQGMMSNYRVQNINTEQTVAEEAQGKVIWEKFQAKEIICANLSDDDFDLLGEYFMGQMMGTSHAVMNAMMTQQLGEQGETQMHVVMGKRLSGCDSSAAYPNGGVGFMPMMQMMWGGWSYPGSGYSGMMNFGYGFWGVISILSSLIWFVAGILVIVWLLKRIQKK